MLNIDKIEKAYLACGHTDLRKSIDGLVILSSIRSESLQMAYYNRGRNKSKY